MRMLERDEVSKLMALGYLRDMDFVNDVEPCVAVSLNTVLWKER